MGVNVVNNPVDVTGEGDGVGPKRVGEKKIIRPHAQKTQPFIGGDGINLPKK